MNQLIHLGIIGTELIEVAFNNKALENPITVNSLDYFEIIAVQQNSRKIWLFVGPSGEYNGSSTLATEQDFTLIDSGILTSQAIQNALGDKPVLAGGNTDDTAKTLRDDVNIKQNVAANIANLKTVDVSKIKDGDEFSITGHSIKGDGGGGVFFWNASSTATPDDGTIIQVNGQTNGRFIRKRFGTPVIPEWFGAKGDFLENGSNDTEALLKLFKHRNIALTESKHYGVSESLIPLSDTILEGNNSFIHVHPDIENDVLENPEYSLNDKGEVIKCRDVENVTLRNFTIKKDGVDYAFDRKWEAGVITFRDADHCLVNNVTVDYDFAFGQPKFIHGIVVTGLSEYVKIDSCTFNTVGIHYAINGAKYTHIENCIIRNSCQNALTANGNSSINYIIGCRIRNNKLYNCGRMGIEDWGQVFGTLIEGNEIYGVGKNTFEDYANRAFGISAVAFDISVIKNIIEDFGEYGIEAPGHKGLIIKYNLIKGKDDATSKVGIMNNSTGTQELAKKLTILEGNTIEYCRTAINIFGSNYPNVNAVNNIILDPIVSGIVADYTSPNAKINISKNKIYFTQPNNTGDFRRGITTNSSDIGISGSNVNIDWNYIFYEESAAGGSDIDIAIRPGTPNLNIAFNFVNGNDNLTSEGREVLALFSFGSAAPKSRVVFNTFIGAVTKYQSLEDCYSFGNLSDKIENSQNQKFSFFDSPPISKPTVSGIIGKGGKSLAQALNAFGLINDNSNLKEYNTIYPSNNYTLNVAQKDQFLTIGSQASVPINIIVNDTFEINDIIEGRIALNSINFTGENITIVGATSAKVGDFFKIRIISETQAFIYVVPKQSITFGFKKGQALEGSEYGEIEMINIPDGATYSLNRNTKIPALHVKEGSTEQSFSINYESFENNDVKHYKVMRGQTAGKLTLDNSGEAIPRCQILTPNGKTNKVVQGGTVDVHFISSKLSNGTRFYYWAATGDLEDILISETSRNFNSAGGNFDIIISTLHAWSIDDDSDWIIFSKTSGVGSDRITITVEANPTPEISRVTNIEISDSFKSEQLTIQQNVG
ncbi:BACON domain-containing protein [Zunongwangia pacifica]|uniref:Right-handed parallel beta-helix repeat-containing protein n=1 Tax=Zunongwangia pacifica TaxID=2911062 RepID=A0A9X2CL35_9FLAO|nr:right-handed parallel beta-helix repeat-containing protein [Zunongwangia pacifica]MCL6219601.1 right-handed parallel beta-helix repeat-containing protein [Zunongwangia pacifica]